MVLFFVPVVKGSVIVTSALKSGKFSDTDFDKTMLEHARVLIFDTSSLLVTFLYM